MKSGSKVALVYGAVALGAGLSSFLRGRRNLDLAGDVLVHSAVIGTGISVVVLVSSSSVARTNPLFGKKEDPTDPSSSSLGKITPKGYKLLSSLDTEQLYAPMREKGVKIGPVSSDPAVVKQEI